MAVADAIDAGTLRRSAWIIRRTTMRVRQLPSFSERLELTTWCSGVAKSVAERSTSITGDLGAAVEVEAIWVHIDPESRRPARLPADFHDAYDESAAGRRPRTSLRHPAEAPADAEHLEWSFVDADVDIAGHVNNTMYWRVAEEHLDLTGLGGDGGSAIVEAEYRSGISAGPASVSRADNALWVSAPAGEVAATLRIGAAEPL